MKPVLPALGLGVGLAVALAAGAQEAPPGSRLAEAQRIGRELSTRFNAAVLVDTAAAPISRPRKAETPTGLAASLDTLAVAFDRGRWSSLYLPARKLETTRPARAAGIARALASLPAGGLAVERPRDRELTLLREPASGTANAEREAAAAGLAPRPIRIVYGSSAAGDGRTEVERLMELERQQLGFSLPEGRRGIAMEQIGRRLQVSDKGALEQLLLPVTKAGMQVWEGIPGEERREMMRSAMTLLQSTASPSPPAAGTGSSVGLRQAAEALSRRARVPIVVDPALAGVTVSPPGMDLPVERALDALSTGVPGVVWRRVYLPDPRPEAIGAERLAETVRSLEGLADSALLWEDPRSRKVLAYHPGRPATPRLGEELRAAGLSTEPTYVLLTVLEGPGSVEERLARLVREQTDLVVRMPAEQLGERLTEQVRAYQGADPETRARLLSLPSMAVMMAVWFPRAAKEGGLQ